MNLNKLNKYYEVIIIGSGIAGSTLAFELEKYNINYLICTDQTNPLKNTSTISYGHCRLTNTKNIKNIIKKQTKELGDNFNTVNFIYSKTYLVSALFKELRIKHEKRSFGIIPSGNQRGGGIIMKNLQNKINKIHTNYELINYEKKNDFFKISLKSDNKKYNIKSKYLILATGGFGGSFEYTDNIRYNNYNIFKLVEKNGGKIINENCIFKHPFGYNNGKSVLIGKESSKGEFIDENGKLVFTSNIRKKIKNDNYHEIFPILVKIIEAKLKCGNIVYFKDKDKNKNKKIKVVPTVHYTSGGIKTNHLGEVEGCKNLFAIGECQANGSKGSGRLPGYALTAAIVQAKELSKILKNKI